MDVLDFQQRRRTYCVRGIGHRYSIDRSEIWKKIRHRTRMESRIAMPPARKRYGMVMWFLLDRDSSRDRTCSRCRCKCNQFFWLKTNDVYFSIICPTHSALPLMQISVWGGPLRLQATAQHSESPKLFLRRIIHHPIQWIREMEEWKHFSLKAFRHSDRSIRKSVSEERAFNPDPLLFPATWLPLR